MIEITKYKACRIGVSIAATVATAVAVYFAYVYDAIGKIGEILGQIVGIAIPTISVNLWSMFEVGLMALSTVCVILAWIVTKMTIRELSEFENKHGVCIGCIAVILIVVSAAVWCIYSAMLFLHTVSPSTTEQVPVIDIWVWAIPALTLLLMLFYESSVSRVVCKRLKRDE